MEDDDNVQGNIIPTFNRTEYDNDITLMYKAANLFGYVTRLIIVRPKTEEDFNQEISSDTVVFELLPDFVANLIQQNVIAPEIYNIVVELNSKINIDDVAMSYYIYFYRKDNSEGITRDYYSLINEVYKEINNSEDVDKFSDERTLAIFYTTWAEQNKTGSLRSKEENRLDQIIEVQNTLDKVKHDERNFPVIDFSPININSKIMAFFPTIQDRSANMDDGLDIFNNSITSRYVPYIKYNDKYDKSYFRVYVGSKVEREPNFSMLIAPQDKTTDRNTIYLTLWLGDPFNSGEGDLYNAPRESFQLITYNLNTNLLKIEVPTGVGIRKGLLDDEYSAYNRCQNAIPHVTIGNGKRIKVRGEFDIWNFEYEECTFLDDILNSPVMNVYLYVEENMTAFANKKRLDIHYRSIFSDEREGATQIEEQHISNSAAVSMKFNQKITIPDQVLNIVEPRTQEIFKIKSPNLIPYIHVNITQAESEEVVEGFLKILQLLLRFYNSRKAYFFNTNYLSYIPEFSQLADLITASKLTKGEQKKIASKPKGKRIGDKLDLTFKTNLKSAAPEIFVKHYGRTCQNPPIIIGENEIEQWRNKLTTAGEYRSILKFPAYDPVNTNLPPPIQYTFVCPTDVLPYPGVRENKKCGNRGIYPYVPCCFQKDQQKGRKNPTKLQKYLAKINPDFTKGAKAEDELNTDKILSADSSAMLPKALAYLLSEYNMDNANIVRYGIGFVGSTNSLLHCILIAIEDRAYLNLNTFEQREQYARLMRTYIAQTIKPSLLKQELFDYSDEEIVELLGNNDKFLDPSLVFRALEEIFSINIYTFSLTTHSRSVPSIVVPRFKIFHSHPLRINRHTVLIIKNEGSESNNLAFPHCELITDYNKINKNAIKLFKIRMTEICQRIMQESLKTLTCEYEFNNKSFDIRSNIYYYIDHIPLFELKPISQIIDVHGKMRAINFDLGQNRFMTTIIIPSQPENLVSSTHIYRTTIEIATYIFGLPSTKTINKEGLIDGLWFKMLDIDEAEYIPIEPYNDILDIPVGSPNPLETQGINLTSRINKLKRDLNIIKQLIVWLYKLSQLTYDIDPIIFVTKFMVLNNTEVEDSSTFYNLSRIPRKLPIVSVIEDGISQLSPLAPTLFDNGKIVMYNAAFANSMIKFLQDYHESSVGLPVIISNFIDNYYDNEGDFIQIPNSKIFLSGKDVELWLNSYKTSQNYKKFYNVHNTINQVFQEKIEPYLYEDEDQHIYVIQNVRAGSIYRAFSLGITWKAENINRGYYVEQTETIPNYMVYIRSSDSHLIPIDDHTNDSSDFVRILYYGNIDSYISKSTVNLYAAILPIS